MQQIDFYCKKCKKSMKISYMVSGDKEAPVMAGITIRCHTNKCNRAVMLKYYTEGRLIEQAKDTGKCYL